MDEKEFAELAAGAALNALSPADRQAFEAARRAHPEWEHWALTDAATAASLADGVSDAPPPLTLRSTLLSRIATTPQVPAVDASVAAAAEPARRWVEPPPAEEVRKPVEPPPPTAVIQAVSRRNWTRGILGLAASMVLLVALGLGAALLNDYVNRPPEIVALQQIEGASDAQSATVEVTDGGTATAHWSESVGKVVLESQGLPAIADDQSFELWFVRDGTPVSAGTFEAPDGAATALLDGAMEPGDTIAVTIEPQGGSPTGEPSSEPIVAIPTA
jgi:anti-sigma-K factor RskA